MDSDEEMEEVHRTTQTAKQILMDWFRNQKERVRPWGTFFAFGKLKLNFKNVPHRMKKNLEYFKVNYVIVFMVIFIVCLLTSPLVLLANVASFGVAFSILFLTAKKQRSVFGHMITLDLQVVAVNVGLTLCTVFFLWLCGIGGEVLIVFSLAFVISSILIGLHASMYDIGGLLGLVWL